MLAISSVRPHADDPEYARNQIKAHRSWLPMFDRVYYFGQVQSDLENSKTFFIPSEEFPPIRSMVMSAANAPFPYVAILNADIILTTRFVTMMKQMVSMNAWGGTSRRKNFDPEKGLTSGTLDDLGVDVFIATPVLWRKILRVVPANIRIGHPSWDTFILGALNIEGRSNFVDFTNFDCVYHPRHEGRKHPYGITAAVTWPAEQMNNVALPGRKLK